MKGRGTKEDVRKLLETHKVERFEVYNQLLIVHLEGGHRIEIESVSTENLYYFIQTED